MGFNPFKSAKKAIKKVTKPISKVGKFAVKNALPIAATAAAGYGGYQAYQYLNRPTLGSPNPHGSPSGGSWLGSALGNAGSSFLSGVGSAAGQSIGGFGGQALAGSLLGNQGNPVGRKEIRMGHDEDTRSYKQRSNWDYMKAEQRGLTPQEFYGSPAAGGSASSGGASTLGNSLTQVETQKRQQATDAYQRSLDRQTNLAQTKMQTDAQIKTAEISAGANLGSSQISADASRYAADLNNAIQKQKLKLNSEQLYKIAIPAAAAQLGKTAQETAKLVNEVATTLPSFVRKQTLLKMGVENTVQTALLNRFGKDITSEKAMSKLTNEEFSNLLAVLVGIGSISNREMQGFMANATGMIDSLTGKQTPQFDLTPFDQRPGQNNKSATNKRPRKNTRGHGARN